MNASALELPSPARSASPTDLRAGPALDPAVFARVRRRAILDGCKWDPQVGDVDTLASFPLLLSATAWRELAQAAEALAAETLALEAAVLGQPALLRKLGLPHAVRAALQGPGELTPGAARVMRFDFHPAREGWRLSEVNSDVPGGYTESSFFTRLMAEQSALGEPAGDPTGALLDALARAAGPDPVALLSAPGYMEDHQITAFLARSLAARGIACSLANPTQLRWRDGLAHLDDIRLGAVVRFYQGEWLARMPARFGWENFFRGGRTPVANPGRAIISESKRLPLLWDALGVPVPAWRRCLPETRDAREAPWRRDEGWLVKSAYCNTGDTVGFPGLRPAREWRWHSLEVTLRPSQWIAQRRFDSVPVDTPAGPRHACIGVYTVDGRAAGAYARLAARPLIDFEAMDAALLIDHDHP